MDEKKLQLTNAPIVEAVIDIDCDMPPTLDLKALEEQARDQFRETYPKFTTRFLREHKIEMKGNAMHERSFRHEIQAFQFLHEDEKQLVQVRKEGFSFNRLAPYSSLDDYLPEIERTWGLFCELASPVQVRVIRLRYINRLPLPSIDGGVELDDYLKIGPRIPDEDRLVFAGFLNRHNATERETGNEVNIVLASQAVEDDVIPILFDITAAKAERSEPEDWDSILPIIQSLRNLKNRIFRDTLSEKCLKLFQ